ncbi:MAG: DNA mismatch repair protein MutS [Bryobacteraceae bacterium]
MTDPRQAYTALLSERRAEILFRERRQASLGYGRLAAAVCAAVILWLALVSRALSIAWVLVPMAAFGALVVVHDRLLRRLDRVRRAVRYFEKALARLDGTWQGAGESGDRYLDPRHPYAQDLDLFGKGSLFELISTARTHIGEDTLARWLLAPADPATIRARQQAVDELRPRLDLRESLAVLADDARTGVNPTALAAWGEAPVLLQGTGLRVALWLLTTLGIIGAAALFTWIFGVAGFFHLPESVNALARDLALFVALVNSLFLYQTRHAREAVVNAVEEAAHELALLSAVLVHLESERFHSPLLAALRQSLDTEDAPPSRRIARLDHLLEQLDSRDHVIVRLLQPFLLWTMHVALGVEDWRRISGPAVRRWLTATGETEALCSLASQAFEHPEDPFPEFIPAGDVPTLHADAIAHPLIPAVRAVRNDLHLGAEPQVYVVSGSNMSGKSTLLRTIGVNVVLAQAGAPVRARALRLSPLALGASIRLTDSLHDGVSRFYAEILRIRQILDATAGPLPVLFLIDEFLAGTNSHDRSIGAEALVRGLVERHSIGLITTHDLALAAITTTLGSHAANIHFEDQIENGKMRFDYLIRPGVVKNSNAIQLMRSVGLEI